MFRDERLERRVLPRRDRRNLVPPGVPDRRHDEVFDLVIKRDVRPVVEILAHRLCTVETHLFHYDEIQYEYLAARSDGSREWLALERLTDHEDAVPLLTAYTVRLSSRWSVLRGPIGE